MATVPRRRGASQRYTSKEFAPYATALGQVAMAWNDLQENLKGLFWTLSMNGPPQEGDSINYAPLFVWGSLQSDRQQRGLLKALVKHSSVDWGRPNLPDDAEWLIKEVDDVESARNDCVHSPLFATAHSLFGSGAKGPVAPSSWLWNSRALALIKRSEILGVLGEFRHTRDRAIALSDYVAEINSALVNPQRAWPRRPRLPSRQAKRSRPGDRRSHRATP
jgi:hypothetical protein